MSRIKAPPKKPRAKKRKRKAALPVGFCPLTKLPQGDTARALWVEAIQTAHNTGKPCTLALFDLDGFARHAKNLGPERADALLAGVASRLASALGDARLGRLAGDVFGVLLDTEVERALATVESARDAAARTPLRVGRGVRKRKVDVALSAGLAALRRDASGLRGLIEAAQGALWRAKSLGGNRCALSTKDRMALKTSYYSQDQLARLKRLAVVSGRKESVLLREALEDLFLKHKDRRSDAEGVNSGTG